MRRAFCQGLVAAAAASTLVLSACEGDDGGGSTGGGEGQPASVKIGFMGDLTGENSGIVIPHRNGAQMAIDEYNATNPKTKIELKPYDSQGVPEQATALAQQAVNTDKIVGLIGPAFSGESQQVGPIDEEGKIPSVTIATNATLAEKGWKYWHRILPGDRIQGTGIGEFIARALSAKNVFVIHDNQDYSKGIADFVTAALKGKGVTVESDVIDPQGSDYASTVNKVKPANPDAIFYGGYYAQAGRLLKQLREGGVTARFLSGDGSLDPGLAKGAGGTNADGALVGCPCYVPDEKSGGQGKVKTFVDAYKAKFNTPPAIYAAEGYDAATAFIEAIKAGKTTAEDINTYLSTIDVPGVTKQIKFGSNGEPAGGDIFIYLFKGQAYSLLGRAAEATVN